MFENIKITLKTGLTFALKIWGEKSLPPLFALHGWLDNAASFDPVAPFLQNHYRLIAVDLIGHGETDHLPACCHYHFIDTVDDVLSLADYFGYEKFSLLGHSMGATIAPLVAATFHEHVQELFLIEGIGPLTDTPDNATLRLRKYLKLSQRGRHIKSYQDINVAINTRVRNSAMTFASAEKIVTRGMIFKDGLYYWRHDTRLLYPSGIMYTEEHVLDFLQNIQCPTKLIWAENGIAFPKTIIQKRQKQIQNLKVSQIPGGHHAHMDYPEETAKFILSN